MKESYGGHIPSQSELTRSLYRGYAGYMDNNHDELREQIYRETEAIRDQRRINNEAKRENEEIARIVPLDESVQDIAPVLELADVLSQNIKHRNRDGTRAQRATEIGVASGEKFSPMFFEKVEKYRQRGSLQDKSASELLVELINFSGEGFIENEQSLNPQEASYARAEVDKITRLLVEKFGMGDDVRGWSLSDLRRRAVILSKLEDAESKRVDGLEFTAMASPKGKKGKGGGGGRGARPEYMSGYGDIDSMQAVCELIAGSYGEKWEKGGDRSLLRKIDNYYTYQTEERVEKVKKGGENGAPDEEEAVVKEYLRPVDVMAVNQGNFMNWVISRIMWLHDDSPDDAHNFMSSIGVENPWKTIGIGTMVNQDYKYFKDKRVVSIGHKKYEKKESKGEESIREIADRYNKAFQDAAYHGQRTDDQAEWIGGLKRDEVDGIRRQNLTFGTAKNFAFETVVLKGPDGEPMLDVNGKQMVVEQITGVIDEYVHKELVEEIKRTTWAATTLRAKDISYRGGMGSDEGLPKTIVEIYKDNNLTKGTWSNKSLWYWVCTMPSTFRTSIGNIENEAILDSYEIHNAFTPEIQRVIERAIPVAEDRENFYRNFAESSPDTRSGLLNDLARQEDAKVGAAVVALYLSYYNLSDYDELRKLYSAGEKESMLFKPSTMFKQRKGLSLDEHVDEETLLSTKKIIEMYGIRTDVYKKDQHGNIEMDDQGKKIIEKEGYETMIANRLEQKKTEMRAQLLAGNNGGELTQEQEAQIGRIRLSVDEIGEIADGLATVTNQSKNNFIEYFNFFIKASPDKRNMRLVRGVLKAAASEHVGMNFYRDARDGRDETLQEVDDVSSELNFADMMAFAQVRFTLAAARNDSVAAGYDAGSKIINFLQYRFKQPNNGGNLGNWYNLSVFRQTGRDLMTAITTTSAEEGDGKHFKTPLHVFEEIHRASKMIDPKNDTRSAGTVKTARQLTFDEQAMGQTSVNHYNRSFQIFHSVIGSKELRMEKLVHHDPIKGVVIEPDVFGEAVQETFLKPLRYCFKTHSGLDYSEIVRKRVMFDAQNPMHVEARKNGATIYGKPNGQIVTIGGNVFMYDEHDPAHVEAKERGDIMNGPGEEIIMEMPLAYSLFGSQVFDHEDFWVKEYEKDTHGKPVLDSHGHKKIKTIKEHVVDVNALNGENRALIFKRVAIARIAADLWSHRDPASPFSRLDAITIDTIIEALEQIPGELYMDESDMARTRVTKAFITHADIDALTEMGRIGFYKTFAEDSYRVFFQGMGSSLAGAGAATIKAIFS